MALEAQPPMAGLPHDTPIDLTADDEEQQAPKPGTPNAVYPPHPAYPYPLPYYPPYPHPPGQPYPIPHPYPGYYPYPPPDFNGAHPYPPQFVQGSSMSGPHPYPPYPIPPPHANGAPPMLSAQPPPPGSGASTPGQAGSAPPDPASASPSMHLQTNGSSANDAIDLTSSRSPSPRQFQSQRTASQSQIDALANGFATLNPSAGQVPLPDSMLPKTPVCIGQLNVTALVTYPTNYTHPTPGVIPDLDWAPVRLFYDKDNNASGQDTIHVTVPPVKGAPQSTNRFSVVESRVALVLGPMMGKGLIRLDGKVKRGHPASNMLPLEMLVFTPKGNIPIVSQYLRAKSLLLDHPRPQKCNFPYFNPHNPPPQGWGPQGLLSAGQSRWTQQVSGKSVEVQRSQAEELFKSLQSGDELPECEAPECIKTTLYPHQKKALTFLLEREREIVGEEGRSTLWQERQNPITDERSWCHLVTQREVFEEPSDCKGAILADDMGLGKTITCVSLIAATLQSARQFEKTPLEKVQPPASTSSSSLSAGDFAGSVYGMPTSTSKASQKAKAKESKAQDVAHTKYARACRLKTRSRGTLIICPLSTVSNWEDQIREHWKGPVTVVGGSGSCSDTPVKSEGVDEKDDIRAVPPLRVYVYHGNARRPDPVFLANHDVVITTFSTLSSEYSKQSRSTLCDEESGDSDIEILGDNSGPPPKKAGKRKRVGNGQEITSALQSVYWFRVVLDEAHSIKEISTVACRSSCDLMADRRLCLTGTPVQNKLDDVFALIKFLRLEPIDDKNAWTEFIGTPVKYGQPLGVARLRTIMKCITLRRTKESKTSSGERILELPPRRDELRYLKFDADEQAVYDRFFNESKAEFRKLSNKNEVMKNYVGILQKILRLRQICDHVDLVKGKSLSGEQDTFYEETIAAIINEGITHSRAAVVFSLMRDGASAQCAECGAELAPAMDELAEPADNSTLAASGSKRTSKKAKMTPSRGPTRASSPSGGVQPVLTRCQHLFCICCYKRSYDAQWPHCAPDLARPCSVCQAYLRPIDALVIDPNCVPEQPMAQADPTPTAPIPKKRGKRDKATKEAALRDVRMSTKVKALIGDLLEFSRANPNSRNYAPDALEVQMVDSDGNASEGIIKTVVFSQWTSMLDKVEDALEAMNIRYDRLDGTMKREDRSRAMDALKNDPACEVLLVSLKAGGVGLNLTAAQRVYLMDPYWNPAVENQAVDRIHRLGQTRPVVTVKLIIEKSIEARLLDVQKKKTDLANLTLGAKQLSKEQLMQRRLEELQQLFN